METKKLLEKYFILDVVNEIVKYTLPLKDDYSRGLVGNLLDLRSKLRNFVSNELCMNVGDINECLKGACEGGHMEIVKYMIEKGADDWHGGLEGACYGGHMEIVKYMIEKGADDWNGGLYNACLEENIEIVKYMIKKGANQCNCRKSIEEHL
jgi:ankyrin repeat protein